MASIKKAYNTGLNYVLSGILTITGAVAPINYARAEKTEISDLVENGTGTYCFNIFGKKANEFIQKYMSKGLEIGNQTKDNGLEQKTIDALKKSEDVKLTFAGIYNKGKLDKDYWAVDVKSEKAGVYLKTIVKIPGMTGLKDNLIKLSQFCRYRKWCKKYGEPKKPELKEDIFEPEEPKIRIRKPNLVERLFFNSLKFQKRVWKEDRGKRTYTSGGSGRSGGFTGTIE